MLRNFTRLSATAGLGICLLFPLSIIFSSQLDKRRKRSLLLVLSCVLFSVMVAAVGYSAAGLGTLLFVWIRNRHGLGRICLPKFLETTIPELGVLSHS